MEGGDTAMNHSSPAISLVSRRVMASLVSVRNSSAAFPGFSTCRSRYQDGFPIKKKQDNEEWAKIQARLGMTSRRQSVKA